MSIFRLEKRKEDTILVLQYEDKAYEVIIKPDAVDEFMRELTLGVSYLSKKKGLDTNRAMYFTFKGESDWDEESIEYKLKIEVDKFTSTTVEIEKEVLNHLVLEQGHISKPGMLAYWSTWDEFIKECNSVLIGKGQQ